MKTRTFEYCIINHKEVSITSYIGKAMYIVIPSEIDGLPVTKIGTESFYKKNVNQ